MFRTICLVLIFFISGSNILYWNRDRKLSWEDFKGPAKDWNAAAVTYCGIEINKNRFSGKIKVAAYFNCDSSFYFKDRADSNVLKHEQTHFDIAELFARKMRKEFSETPLFSNKAIQKIYDKWYEEYNRFQIQYEHDTRFGAHIRSQARFDSLVTVMLKELESWN